MLDFETTLLLCRKNTMKKTALHAAVSIALGSALLVSTAAEARPIRIDDGTEVGSSGSWFPIPDLSVPLTIGFDLSFLGQTADSLEIDDGGITLFNGGVEVGSILAFGDGSSPVASAHEWVTLSQPLSPVNGVDITDAFRVLFRSSADAAVTSQIALFKAANGDSFIEFNYDDGNESEGFDISAGPSFGVISDGTSLFDLRSWVTANQGDCLTHWGAFDDLTPPEENSSACTGYFANGDVSSVAALPSAFQAENGGSPDPSSNPIANYRYVVRYPAGTTQPPPTPVPEPATLTLLLSGLLLTVAARSRKSGRA